MIGRIAETIMNFLVALATSIMSFFQRAMKTLMDFLYSLFEWLGDLLSNLFQALIDVLAAFFKVIYDVIYCVLYLIYKIGVLIVKLFQIFWELAKLLVAFINGLVKTVASLFYTPTTSAGHGYSAPMGKVMRNLDVLQLDVVAVILMFLIWIFTAFGVIKIIGSFKNA